jgi:putative spermidine/putrescine transport system permease protein
VTASGRHLKLPMHVSSGLAWGALALPGAIYLLLFYAWPVAEMALRSFTDPSLGLANYQEFLDSPVGVPSLVRTVQTSAVVTLVCLILGYPLAYLMVMSPPRVAGALLSLMLVSLWLSIVARTFAWEAILRDTGLINRTLIDAGLIDHPLPLIRTPLGVAIGMVQVLLPTMVMPLYVIMSGIDRELPKAAAGLGASPFTSFRRVFLPLSTPGVLAGSLLVFVLAMGFYITPFLLGGGQHLMIGELVVDNVQHLRWGYGSAIAVILLVITLGGLVLASRLIRIGAIFGDTFQIGSDT